MDDTVYERLAERAEKQATLPSNTTRPDREILSAIDCQQFALSCRVRGKKRLKLLKEQLGKPKGQDRVIDPDTFDALYDIKDDFVNKFGRPDAAQLDEARLDILEMEQHSSGVLARNALKPVEIWSSTQDSLSATSAVSVDPVGGVLIAREVFRVHDKNVVGKLNPSDLLWKGFEHSLAKGQEAGLRQI